MQRQSMKHLLPPLFFIFVFNSTTLWALATEIDSKSVKSSTAATTSDKKLFDHNYLLYGEILKKYIAVNGHASTVNYSLLKKNDFTKLEQFNRMLGTVTKKQFSTWSKNEQMAFLINAYNSLTLEIMVKNYPVKSIKDIGNIFRSVWKIKFFQLFGQKMNLDEIENGMLRKNYKEARIHFAINCASIGCPMLSDTPYIGAKLEKQLASMTQKFLADSSRNRIVKGKKKIILSKIFDWFEEDFIKQSGSVLKFVAPYLTDNAELRKKISAGELDISYSDYNWDANQHK